MSEIRKKQHIDLAFSTRPSGRIDLGDLFYEPIFSAHPVDGQSLSLDFLGHRLQTPLWVSSMTGGTQKASLINKNLALACGEFGFGMGLGSCRSLLDGENSPKRFADFDVKKYMGKSPLFSNFGIAQLEQLVTKGSLEQAFEIGHKLQADGMIIHVNPLQEWAQEEGDRFTKPPLETIKAVLAMSQVPIIVKEVGQGFGPQSLDALCRLPLAAIEFAGFGGTNFTNIEQARRSGHISGKNTAVNSFGGIGHSVEEMLGFLSQLDSKDMKCKNFILSGGITDPLVGYKYLKSCPYPAVIGMASEFLKHAMGEYKELKEFIDGVNDQLSMADSFLRRF